MRVNSHTGEIRSPRHLYWNLHSLFAETGQYLCIGDKLHPPTIQDC